MPAISSSPLSSGPSRMALPLPVRPAQAGAAGMAPVQNNPAEAAADRLALQPPSSPAPSGKAEVKPTGSALSTEEAARQVRDLQVRMDKLNPALAFVLDQDSGRPLIQLTDRTTKEVIMQFPTDAALQIGRALDQFQKGQLVSRTA